MPLEFSYAARSDVGLRRSNNQDSGYAGPHLLVLCDGMGGPAGGDIASSVAVAHLAQLDTDAYRADEMLPRLQRAMNNAHEELVDRSRNDPQLEGLGTTCIALMRSGDRLVLVHIGDSRAYLLRAGELTQVTKDHSLVQHLLDAGQITEQEAEHHPQRSVVMRILGDNSDPQVDPDPFFPDAVEGDRWLLCSDGLSGVVSLDTIADTLARIEDPGECCDELIQLALRAGAPDNVTCVVADLIDGPAPSTAPQIVGAAAVDRDRPSQAASSPAARAAALSQSNSVVDDIDEDDPAPSRPRFLLFFILVLTVLLSLGTAAGYLWTQNQYYVQIKDEHVVIFRGIPQEIGPWKLSHPVEVTSVDVESLQPVERERLTEPVRRDSREEIDAYVEQLQRSSQSRSNSLPPSSEPVPRLANSPSPQLRYPSDTKGDG